MSYTIVCKANKCWNNSNECNEPCYETINHLYIRQTLVITINRSLFCITKQNQSPLPDLFGEDRFIVSLYRNEYYEIDFLTCSFGSHNLWSIWCILGRTARHMILICVLIYSSTLVHSRGINLSKLGRSLSSDVEKFSFKSPCTVNPIKIPLIPLCLSFQADCELFIQFFE